MRVGPSFEFACPPDSGSTSWRQPLSLRWELDVKRRSWAFLLVTALVCAVASPSSAEEPRPRAGYYGGQFLAGMAGTGAGFFGGGLIAVILARDDRNREYELIGNFVLGGLIGTTVATAGGVYLVGTNDRFGGSFGPTWTGAIAGTLGGLGWMALMEDTDPALIALGVAFPTLGAIFGFNTSRHLKVTPKPEGAVELSFGFEW